MAVRAKFMLTSIKKHCWGDSQTFVFNAQYDTTIPEDRRFAKASPSGEFTIQVDNPLAAAQFELGKQYYFDITPAS
jgi:hypothetical protein